MKQQQQQQKESSRPFCWHFRRSQPIFHTLCIQPLYRSPNPNKVDLQTFCLHFACYQRNIYFVTIWITIDPTKDSIVLRSESPVMALLQSSISKRNEPPAKFSRLQCKPSWVFQSATVLTPCGVYNLSYLPAARSSAHSCPSLGRVTRPRSSKVSAKLRPAYVPPLT